MNKDIEELYKSYQKNSDKLVLETHHQLIKKSEVKNIGIHEKSDIVNRLAAINEVIRERKLEVNIKSAEDKNSNTAFNNYIKDGFKSLIIGIGLFVLCLALLSAIEGNMAILLYIGIIIGGFKFLQGIIELAVGLFIRVSQAKNFK